MWCRHRREKDRPLCLGRMFLSLGEGLWESLEPSWRDKLRQGDCSLCIAGGVWNYLILQGGGPVQVFKREN